MRALLVALLILAAPVAQERPLPDFDAFAAEAKKHLATDDSRKILDRRKTARCRLAVTNGCVFRTTQETKGARMRRIPIALFTIVLTTVTIPAFAQAMKSAEPFAVGTFAFNGQEGVGLVLRQQL